MLINKYKPKKKSEILGNYNKINELYNWLKKWNNKSKRVYFIWGSTGIGKTTSAHLMCKLLGYEKIEYNASNLRSKTNMEKIVNYENKLLNNKKNCIIIDEIDSINDNKSSIFLIKLIKKSKIPLIFICKIYKFFLFYFIKYIIN